MQPENQLNTQSALKVNVLASSQESTQESSVQKQHQNLSLNKESEDNTAQLEPQKPSFNKDSDAHTVQLAPQEPSFNKDSDAHTAQLAPQEPSINADVMVNTLPSATVGTIEVAGQQIEMLSLSQLKANAQAIAQARKEEKAQKARKTRLARKQAKVEADKDGEVKTIKKTKQSRRTKLETTEQSHPEADLTATSESLTSNVALSENNFESMGGEALHGESTESILENQSEPNVAQSLLNSIIANVEQLESRASLVDNESLMRNAKEASNRLSLDSKVLVQPQIQEPNWDEMEEMTSEQIEKYSSMGLQEGDICPVCSNGILTLRHSYKSDFLGCSNYPYCKFHLFTGKRSTVTTLKELTSTCPLCQAHLEVKKGRFGIFIGCSNYPECNYIYHREEVSPAEEIVCPECGQGKLVERRSRSGKVFYGCNAYPDCSFSLFGVPVKVQCQECNFPMMYKKKVKNGIALICGDPLCPSHKKRKRQMLKIG